MKSFLMKNLFSVTILLVLNIFFICASWFGLWGNIVFRDSVGREYVFLGAYSEAQRHREFGYNATLTFGFFTHRVDHWYDGARIAGVTAFCWTHFFLLCLVVVNVLGAAYLLKRHFAPENRKKTL